jgi:crossover junction endodeoxyribonuclease RuvC
LGRGQKSYKLPPVRILGIDPGLATVGIGIIDAASPVDLTVVDWCTITTPAGMPMQDRLLEIQRDLSAMIDDTNPELAVVEKLFFATNERTALDVAQARGVIILTLAERSLKIIEPTPLQMKLGITGDGQADKLQVQTMLKHMLKLDDIPRPDDAADALALAAYGALQHTMTELEATR